MQTLASDACARWGLTWSGRGIFPSRFFCCHWCRICRCFSVRVAGPVVAAVVSGATDVSVSVREVIRNDETDASSPSSSTSGAI